MLKMIVIRSFFSILILDDSLHLTNSVRRLLVAVWLPLTVFSVLNEKTISVSVLEMVTVRILISTMV